MLKKIYTKFKIVASFCTLCSICNIAYGTKEMQKIQLAQTTDLWSQIFIERCAKALCFVEQSASYLECVNTLQAKGVFPQIEQLHIICDEFFTDHLNQIKIKRILALDTSTSATGQKRPRQE